jgi:predicted acetyltransferase
MNIEVIPATPEHRTLMRHLFELYCYDFSPMEGTDVNDAGLYTGDDFLAEWPGPGRHLFLIKVDGHWAGFAWVAEHSFVNPGAPGHYWMAEFFVMQKYRRKGVGASVATRLFDMFPGAWEVGEIPSNVNAQAFWRKVIGRYTRGRYEEKMLGAEKWPGPIQIFSTRRIP